MPRFSVDNFWLKNMEKGIMQFNQYFNDCLF